jgi:hypothetical protein
MTGPSENPYVGPRTFEEKDGRFFYGREREARTLLSSVIAEPLLLFYAQSGAGKSSLINARLIPGLRDAAFAVLPVGRVGAGLPDDGASAGNVFVLNLLLSISAGTIPLSELRTMTLADYLQDRRVAGDGSRETAERPARVLIVDQFEEIVNTHHAAWPQREGFFQQLAQAIQQDDLLWVVLVMREDYVAALDPYLHLLPDRLRNRFYMQRMDIAAAQEAIEKPAELAGRRFAPGVARALIDNLRQIRSDNPLRPERALGQFVEPVQLQVVCYQLWQRLGDREAAAITMQDLHELGDVDTALAQFYEQALATVQQQTGASEIQLRNWFERRLITEAGTRGTVYHGASETAGLDNEIVRQLADQFILRAESRAGGMWYELIHDRFVEPILQANHAWRAGQDPLVRAAAEWDRGGRGKAGLFQGAQLSEALAATEPAQAEPLVADFLLASQDAQNQRDLEAAREKAAADERRAQEEAARARRLRRITAILALAILFALGGTGLAVVQTVRAMSLQADAERDSTRAVEQSLIADAESTRALEQKGIADAESTRAIEEEERARAESTRAAEEQAAAEVASTRASFERATAEAATTRAAVEQATAEAERARAESGRATAEAAGAEAERQGRLLLAQSLAFAALNVAQLGSDSELAALLALEAAGINRREAGGLDDVTETALLSLLSRPYFNVTLPAHEGPVYALAFAEDGQTVASAGEDGTIRLWSLAEWPVTSRLVGEHEGAVRAVVFAPDGTLLAAGDDGMVHFWSLGPRDREENRLEEEDAVLALTLAPDGRQLVTSLASGTIHFWDLDNLQRGATILDTWREPSFRPIHFQESSGRLLAGNPSGALQEWPAGNVFGGPAFVGQADAALTAISSAAGESAFAAADGAIFVRRQRGLDVALLGYHGAVASLDLTGDGQLVASGGDDGAIRLWPMPDVEAASSSNHVRLTAHEGGVLALQFAPDERLLVSAGADGTLRLWQMAPVVQMAEEGESPEAADLAGIACRQVQRNLTWEEWQTYLAGEPYRATCPELPADPSAPAASVDGEGERAG